MHRGHTRHVPQQVSNVANNSSLGKLDDAPEFGDRTLPALRQVLETGEAQLSVAGRRVTYPGRFVLVLAAKPCICAWPTAEPCTTCTAQGRRRYLAQMSGLWQCTDIRLHLAVPDRPCQSGGPSSFGVAQRVACARAQAADRWAVLGVQVNADVPGEVLRTGVCRLPTRDINALLRLADSGAITDGGYDRALRLAWSISDLRGADRPRRDDITAAIDLHLGQQP